MLRFNLRSIMRRTRPILARRGKRITLNEITPTAVQRRDLERLYLRVVRAWWEGSRDRLVPAYRDELAKLNSRPVGAIMDDASQIAGATSSLADEIERLIISLTPSLRDWAVRIETWHRAKWKASMTPTGVDLNTLLGPEDVAETVEATIQRNVALVRSISSEARSRIEEIIFRGFTNRTPAQAVAREISGAVGMSRRRALGISIDQLQKLSAKLDEERFAQAGIDHFEWRHSGKLHPRPHHLARHGKVFALRGEIDPDDMPGIPPYCGCKKRAVIDLD